MAKPIILLVWLAIIASLFLAFPPMLATILQVIGVLLLVGHVVEYFVYRAKIDAKGDGVLKSFLMTMVLGIIYIKDL